MDDFWLTVVLGAIIGAILSPIITEFLPDSLRFKAKYAYKRFVKLIHPPAIDITLSAKSEDLTSRTLEAAPTMERIRLSLIEAGLEVLSKADGLVINLQIGSTRTSANLAMSIEPKSAKLITTQIEFRFKTNISYRKFNEQILELTQAQRKIENLLKYHTQEIIYSTSLSCRLESTYELAELLSHFQINSLSATGPEMRFDLMGKELTIYADSITGRVTSFLKRMITLYS